MTDVRQRPVGPCLEVLARESTDAVVMWDPSGRCFLWNEAAERMFGLAAERAVGRLVREFMPVDDPGAVDACVAATAAGEECPEAVREFACPDGTRGAMRSRCAPLRNGRGQLIGGMAILHDLTPHRLAEAERAASGAMRRAVFDAALDSIIVVDDAGRFVDANAAACALTGRPLTSLLGATVGDVAEPGFDAAAWSGFLAGGRGRGVLRIARPDGSVRTAEFVARAAFLPGRNLAILRDVTERVVAQRAIRESEARFRALFDGTPLPVIVFRWDGKTLTVLDANDGIRDGILGPVRTGADACDLLGRRPDVLAALVSCPAERRTVESEFDWCAPADGSALRIRSIARFIEPDLVLLIAEDVTERHRMEERSAALLAAERAAREEAEAATCRNQALTHRLAGVLESERTRIARELHDEIGQQITAVRMRIDGALQAPGDVRSEVVRSVGDALGGLLGTVRGLVLALRPPVLDDLGLVAAVEALLRRVGTASGIRTDFRQSGASRRFPPPVEVAAYRIVQESLTNAVRHAAADSLDVRVWTAGDTLFVQVQDDGRGFDADAECERPAGSGIGGMRERADLVGGSVAIESSPGRGTVVTAALPAGERGP